MTRAPEAATRPCPFPLPNYAPSEWMPWDQLHSLAAVFGYRYGDVDGIGGTRRITDEDEDTLHDLIADAKRMAELADAALKLAAWTARDHGMTWGEIGSRIGIAGQAARKRFGGSTSAR